MSIHEKLADADCIMGVMATMQSGKARGLKAGNQTPSASGSPEIKSSAIPIKPAVSLRERLILTGKQRPSSLDPVPLKDQRDVQRAVVEAALRAGASLFDPDAHEAIEQTIRAEYRKRGMLSVGPSLTKCLRRSGLRLRNSAP